MKDLKKTAQELQKYGRGGDTILAHITPEEAALLKSRGGAGTINPDTGLPEFLSFKSLVGAVAPAVGSFFGGPIGGAIGSVVGGLFQGDAATSAANAQLQAAQGANAAQLEAAKVAASAGAFRPVGISTRFGTSGFTMGTDQYGNPIVTGAGYTTSPELQALQNRIAAMYGGSLGMAEQAMPAAQGLFNLGAGYLSETPEAAQQRAFDQLQSLGAAQRAEEEARLGASVFGRGRAGLNVGGIQPELYGLARAREEQRARDALTARQIAQGDITFGTGLMTQGLGLPAAALSPFQSQFGLQTALEAQAMQPLQLGAELGGRNINPYAATSQYQAGAAAANRLFGAQQQAIGTKLAGQQQLYGTGTNLLQQYLNQMNFGGTQAPITDYSMYETGGGGFATTPGWESFEGAY